MPIIGSLAGASSRGLGGLRTFVPISTTNYFSLETQTLTSTETSITFNSISQDYTHLQVRMIGRTTRSDFPIEDANLRINGDTGNNYSWQRMFNDPVVGGTTIACATGRNVDFINSVIIMGTDAIGANKFGTGIVDFIDYKNTNKYKTIKSLNGVQIHGDTASGYSDFVEITGGVWNNTNAINSITIFAGVTQFKANSQFALYGIK